MYLFAVLAAFVSLIVGIVLATRTKKADGVLYGQLDQLGIVTNALLIPAYIVLSFLVIALSVFSVPEYEGFFGTLGWIVCMLIAMGPLLCGIGLGLSVSLRKKGRSKLSFVVQFAGAASCGLSVLLFMLFYGNLLSTLN